MKLDSLRDVLVDCVRDLYSAETQIVKARRTVGLA